MACRQMSLKNQQPANKVKKAGNATETKDGLSATPVRFEGLGWKHCQKTCTGAKLFSITKELPF